MPEWMQSKELIVAVGILGPLALMLAGPITEAIKDWSNRRAGRLRKE